MSKGIACLIVFCIATLVLFVALIFLLSNVNPPQIHPLPPLPGEGKKAKLRSKPDSFRKMEDPEYPETWHEHERMPAIQSFVYKEGQPGENMLETDLAHENTTEKHLSNSTDTIRRFSACDDNATKDNDNPEGLSEPPLWLTSSSSDASNASEQNSVKGFRRSIENKKIEEFDNDDPHKITLKIIDDKGKPRLEIVVGKSDSADIKSKNRLRRRTMLKFYKFVAGKGHNVTEIYEADESKPTVIRVMSNNSLILNHPDDLSEYASNINHSLGVHFMEESYEYEKNNHSRKIRHMTNRDHNNNIVTNDVVANVQTSSMFLDNPFEIKVRFDNKTETPRNESTS